MTREEADFIGAMNMCDEISNEAYKKIMCHCEEQESCEDAVSRKAIEEMLKARKIGSVMTFDHFIELLYELPPVTPTQRWIPVKKRLPEESLNSVIGWDAYRERCVFVQFIDGHFQITGKNESFDMQAWMPLPEPYVPDINVDKMEETESE